jgi:hypothetical protein
MTFKKSYHSRKSVEPIKSYEQIMNKVRKNRAGIAKNAKLAHYQGISHPTFSEPAFKVKTFENI